MVHGRTPATSLGSQLCGTGWLGPAPAGSSPLGEAGRSQEVAVVGADRSAARCRIKHGISAHHFILIKLMCTTQLVLVVCFSSD